MYRVQCAINGAFIEGKLLVRTQNHIVIDLHAFVLDRLALDDGAPGL